MGGNWNAYGSDRVNSPRIDSTDRLARLDREHVWHPFTPMRQWREANPLIIERGDGPHLVDTRGRRYIDGVSSLWCNVHGHRVPQIDEAIREQLDRVAHTTLLGLASPPSIELAARLVEIAPGGKRSSFRVPAERRLNRVFYSDAGATAVEVAFKMAVGYWHHRGRPDRNRFIGLQGAYHGDTTGAMSVGYSEAFHRPFVSMVFEVTSFPCVDPVREFRAGDRDHHTPVLSGAKGRGNRDDAAHRWAGEEEWLIAALAERSLSELERMLEERGGLTAAVVVEPVMQGAAGMIAQPPGFVRRVRELCDRYDVLLIADEVATGLGRTGAMFACEHDGVVPDILCVAKGLTGGYLPLAATLATDQVEAAFTGELHQRRTLYHGHTYTGNPLASAAAIASLDLFESTRLLDHIRASADLIARRLDVLRDGERFPHIIDVRQRGLMVGIELGRDRETLQPLEASLRAGATVCEAMRERGVILRPLGDVVVLMPIPAMGHDVLSEMLDMVIDALERFKPGGR